jgi:hypothetical protein
MLRSNAISAYSVDFFKVEFSPPITVEKFAKKCPNLQRS